MSSAQRVTSPFVYDIDPASVCAREQREAQREHFLMQSGFVTQATATTRLQHDVAEVPAHHGLHRDEEHGLRALRGAASVRWDQQVTGSTRTPGKSVKRGVAGRAGGRGELLQLCASCIARRLDPRAHEGDDAGVVQLAEQLDLPLELLHASGVLQLIRVERLDSDLEQGGGRRYTSEFARGLGMVQELLPRQVRRDTRNR